MMEIEEIARKLRRFFTKAPKLGTNVPKRGQLDIPVRMLIKSCSY